jgi:hypothetical protein
VNTWDLNSTFSGSPRITKLSLNSFFLEFFAFERKISHMITTLLQEKYTRLSSGYTFTSLTAFLASFTVTLMRDHLLFASSVEIFFEECVQVYVLDECSLLVLDGGLFGAEVIPVVGFLVGHGEVESLAFIELC